MDPFSRKQKWGPHGKDAEGRKLCHCGCGRPVTPPRRTSHSMACVNDWKARNDPQTIARLVLERDRGICAHCGLDTEAARQSVIGGCPFLPPDPFEIADALGHQHQFQFPDGKTHRFWYDTKLKPDVQAAWEIADYFYNRELRAIYEQNQIELRDEYARRGFTDSSRRWWEADHIVPVVEGGGGCGPEGYRTLCLPCHRIETAKLAARRAEKRRAAKQPTLPL